MMSKDLPLYRDGRCDKCDRDDWNKLIPGTDPPVYLCSRCRENNSIGNSGSNISADTHRHTHTSGVMS